MEGRINAWLHRQTRCSSDEFIQRLLDFWSRDYSHFAIHPNHREENEREILKLKRHMRRLKTERGKQRIRDQIEAIKENIDGVD